MWVLLGALSTAGTRFPAAALQQLLVLLQAKWHSATVAVKILRRSDEVGLGDFRTELNVLQKVRLFGRRLASARFSGALGDRLGAAADKVLSPRTGLRAKQVSKVDLGVKVGARQVLWKLAHEQGVVTQAAIINSSVFLSPSATGRARMRIGMQMPAASCDPCVCNHTAASGCCRSTTRAACNRPSYHLVSLSVAQVHHPHAVRFFGACTKRQPYMIVTEFLPGGSLADVFAKCAGSASVPKPCPEAHRPGVIITA